MPSPARASLSLVVGGPRREVADAELVRGLMSAHDWAIGEAWQRFAPMVLALAERGLGSRSDAEDLTQEVFLRVFRRVGTLRDPTSLRSFVYSIAIRALKSELRFRRLKSWLSFQSPETLVDLRAASPDPDARELLRNLYLLLDRLSSRERLVFLLRRAESMTVEEIACALEISPSTVKRSLARASERLGRWIDRDAAMSELLDSRFGGGGQ